MGVSAAAVTRGTHSEETEMLRFVLSRQILKPDQLAALGSVVAESTYLESLVDSMIGHLARLTESQRNIILKRAMLHVKLEVLRELGDLKLKSAPRKSDFLKLISRLMAHNDERVTAVHGVWTPIVREWRPGFKLSDFLVPSGDAEARHSRGTITASRLDKLAEKISNGFWDLSDFNTKVWLRTSARKKVVRALMKSRRLPPPPRAP